MNTQFSRTEALLGPEAMEKLYRSHVAIFGVGGVGGYTVEALARSGIGQLTLIDPDDVGLTNINRQILATHENLGQLKVEAAKQRILAINPAAKVTVYPIFYTPETADTVDLRQFDYIVDAIDTVTGKLCLVQRAVEANVPIVSCMGAGNKLDASAFQVADLYETSVCPLARIMRKECRKRGIDRLKVVYSTEEPIAPSLPPDDPAWAELPQGRNALPGSVCFVPAVAGMIIAGEVIKDLIK